MTSIDVTALLGWVIFAIVNSITVVITSRYTNRILDKLADPTKQRGDRKDGTKT
jgi:hypothetical protein